MGLGLNASGSDLGFRVYDPYLEGALNDQLNYLVLCWEKATDPIAARMQAATMLPTVRFCNLY